jgi:hypothetical protein
MGTRGPLPNPLVEYVVALARRGELSTLEEGAMIAGVPRMTVMRALVAAGIDWRHKRRGWMMRHRRRALDALEGRKPKRPTKRQLRAIGARAARRHLANR